MGEVLNLHAMLRRSRANGPGERLVIWFQGCSLACPGCYNPQTHSGAARTLVPVEQVLARICAEQDAIEGISLSGGEPFQQPAALRALVSGVRAATSLSILLFSGYTYAEIERLPAGPAVLRQIDVLIAGRFQRSLRLAQGAARL